MFKESEPETGSTKPGGQKNNRLTAAEKAKIRKEKLFAEEPNLSISYGREQVLHFFNFSTLFSLFFRFFSLQVYLKNEISRFGWLARLFAFIGQRPVLATV